MTYAISIETTPEARHWRCEGWEIVTRGGVVGILTAYDGDSDLSVEVSVDGDDLDVFGEWMSSCGDVAGTIVSIPLPVLRELVRLMEMQAERLEETSDE